MAAGDTIIDGGNTFWKDDIARAAALRERGIHYLDVGTSGGVWGLERGYCLMIGGEEAVVERLDPIFRALAPGAGDIPPTPHREGRDPRPGQGYLHAGPNGAGHFVKMIHNGIEYGMMQAYAEGFDILKHAGDESLPAEHRLDLERRRHRRGLAARQRDHLVAARSHRRGARRGGRSRVLFGPRVGFGRRPLDRDGGGRGGGAGRRADRGALHPLPLAPGSHLRGEDPVGDAQGLRRPSGAASA